MTDNHLVPIRSSTGTQDHLSGSCGIQTFGRDYVSVDTCYSRPRLIRPAALMITVLLIHDPSEAWQVSDRWFDAVVEQHTS